MDEPNVIDGSQKPKIRADIDITKAGLSIEEGFLVSRVDGKTSVAELALLVGKPQEQTSRLVQRLATAGVLVFSGQVEDNSDPYGGFGFCEQSMAESVDLSDDQKREILFTHAHLSEWTHYKLLGCRPGDDAATIKRAYFSRSKRWHPDQFGRGQHGSFKPKINQIFQALTKGYQVLSNSKRKAEYDRAHAPEFDERDMAVVLAAQRREEREAQRQKERKERRKRNNPVLQRIQQAKSDFEKAKSLEASGELMEALSFARSAVLNSGQNRPKEYEELEASLQDRTTDQRIAPLLRKGKHAESMTEWDDAVKFFAEAVRQAPHHGEARLRLANCLVRGQRPIDQINEHIQKAVQLVPEEPETHFVRGLCYMKADMDKAAIGAFQRALELKPNYAEAKKLLKKLRWGF